MILFFWYMNKDTCSFSTCIILLIFLLFFNTEKDFFSGKKNIDLGENEFFSYPVFSLSDLWQWIYFSLKLSFLTYDLLQYQKSMVTLQSLFPVGCVKKDDSFAVIFMLGRVPRYVKSFTF